MLAKVRSCAVIGLEGALVEVEVDIGQGLPAFSIVGLPDAAVNEAKERVRAAIKNSGAVFPLRRITVNLAPADLRKAGPAYDLPIAVAILLASGQVAPLSATGEVAAVEDALFLGELSLDCGLRHTHGILPMVALARERGVSAVYVPVMDAREASLVEAVTVYPVERLSQLMASLRGEEHITPYAPDAESLYAEDETEYATDLADVRGQEHVKRALEVAASGGHNMLMSGPPGSGKTLLARIIPSILPRLSLDESLEVTKLYSVSGLLRAEQPLVTRRPFRAPHPHHQSCWISRRRTLATAWRDQSGASRRALSRRIARVRPDCLGGLAPAAGRPSSDHLARSGLGDLSRQLHARRRHESLPMRILDRPNARVYLLAIHDCALQKRLSGPLLDRIDIHVEVPRVEYEKLTDTRPGERSEVVRARVLAARERQARRFAGSLIACNAEMGPAEVRVHCEVEAAAQPLLRAASQRLQLSARAFHRVLKLARTIADLAEADIIQAPHLAEALQYRARVEVG